MWNGRVLRFGGKTDNSQIPVKLINVLQDKYTSEMMKYIFGTENQVCVYGEGYGAGIQKGGNYLSDSVDLISFDINIDGWWLKRNNVKEILNELNTDMVPIIGRGTLSEAVDYVRKGFKSTISENKEYVAEGLILKPVVDIFNRKGERIITKIKYKDFKNF